MRLGLGVLELQGAISCPSAVLCPRSTHTFGLLAALAISASVSQSRRPASRESGDSLPPAPWGVEGSLLVGTLATCRQGGVSTTAGEGREVPPRACGRVHSIPAGL